MAKTSRRTLLTRFQGMVHDGIPIIGGGAGTGLSAKYEEEGGIDLIVIYNSGCYRIAGRSSFVGMLAYGNANEIVRKMTGEVRPVVDHVPPLAGADGTDPFCLFDSFLDDLKKLGFSGIQNFPTVGLIDGQFCARLEETGMPYAMEVEFARLARSKDLLATPYVFTLDDARAMTNAGVDILVAHVGLTTGGAIGARTALSLAGSVERIDAIAEAVHALREKVIVLCHGAPIAAPEDAKLVLSRAWCYHGFFGASSMELLPAERAIAGQTRGFETIGK